MYKRMLVVTGDQVCDAPVEYAIALAAATGAELSILTVLSLPLIAGMPDGTACMLAMENVVAQSQDIRAAAAAAAEQAGVSYTTWARWGNTADMILRLAEDDDCDLIIIGSRAYTWRSRQVLRHVINKLTTSARQPFLMITEPPEETYGGAHWTRLLVVYDGSPEGEAAVHYALALAQEAALDVYLLHVHALRQHYGTVLFGGTPSVPDMSALTAARTAIAGVSHDVVVALGNTVTAITETAADRACDVIILGVAQPGVWKRLLSKHTAEAVLANTTLPVLLVNRLATYCY
jgi:nucleotide-binding universal stress UspA family protein